VDKEMAVNPEPLLYMPGSEYPGKLVFSPSGKYLAVSAGAALKRSARVLEIASGQVLFDHEFRFPIHDLAFDPEERRLGLVGSDSAVRLYDFTRGTPENAAENVCDDESELALCQQVDGRGAHAPPDDFITRSAQDGRARFYLGHEKSIHGLEFDSEGKLFTAGGDGTIRCWPESAPRPGIRLGHIPSTYQLRHPAASADGRFVLFGGTS
jgi:WD40 repeat protein